MKKTLVYGSFVVASIVVIVLFVTTATYTQLIFAVLLYIPLVYFAFQAFSPKFHLAHRRAAITVRLPIPKEDISISDSDKRTFLKMLGAAGLSFILFSLFSKRAEIPFLNKLTGAPPSTGGEGGTTQSEPISGYRIAEIDDNVITYYGFTNKDGGWFIMKEDTETGSFRYVKGDSDFTSNWASRENLKYDLYNKVF